MQQQAMEREAMHHEIAALQEQATAAQEQAGKLEEQAAELEEKVGANGPHVLLTENDRFQHDLSRLINTLPAVAASPIRSTFSPTSKESVSTNRRSTLNTSLDAILFRGRIDENSGHRLLNPVPIRSANWPFPMVQVAARKAEYEAAKGSLDETKARIKECDAEISAQAKEQARLDRKLKDSNVEAKKLDHKVTRWALTTKNYGIGAWKGQLLFNSAISESFCAYAREGSSVRSTKYSGDLEVS